MRTRLTTLNMTAIGQNMALYYFWHTLISTNVVALTSKALEAIGANPSSTEAIVDPLKIGVVYMTAIGLTFRLSLAFGKAKDSHEGKLHQLFTYIYNQEFVGVLTNQKTLQYMMAIGLLHNFFVNNKPLENKGLHEYLFKMFLPAAVGFGLDTAVEKLGVRNLVTNKLKGYHMLSNALVWGGMGAPGAEKSDPAGVAENIHNPFHQVK